MPGEFDFINWVHSLQTPDTRVRVGIGDDLAVLNWPSDDLLLVGVDQVLDGVHFDTAIHSPEAIGRKAMNRNLSDCAAMACLPAAAVVTLALPTGSGEDYARQLYLGMKNAGELFDCPIVGGDTASWPGKLVITVTVIGRAAGITPVTRSGAKSGDKIYVTGPLGGSIMGRHMTFEPRVQLARDLATKFRLHAMADLSDGLARDLRNICIASGVGATLTIETIPIHDDVRRLLDVEDPMRNALDDGEDYELLIISPDELPGPCVQVGRIVANPSSLPGPGGWEHAL